jgi:hypothetical protein
MFSCCTKASLPLTAPPVEGASPQVLLDHLQQRLAGDAVGREVIERLRAELARTRTPAPQRSVEEFDGAIDTTREGSDTTRRDSNAGEARAARTARLGRTRKSFSNSKSAHHMQVLRDAAVKTRRGSGGGLWSVVVRLTKKSGGPGGSAPGDADVAPSEPDAVAMDEVTQAWVQSELDPRKAHYDRGQPRINALAETAHEPGIGSLAHAASVRASSFLGLMMSPTEDGAGGVFDAGAGLLAPPGSARGGSTGTGDTGDALASHTLPLRSATSLAHQPLAHTGSASLARGGSLGGVPGLQRAGSGGIDEAPRGSSSSSGLAPPAVAIPPEGVVELTEDQQDDDRPIGQLPWEAYERLPAGPAPHLRSVRSQAMVHAASMHRVNSREISGGFGLPSSRMASVGGGGGSGNTAAGFRGASVGSPPLFMQVDAPSRGSSGSGSAATSATGGGHTAAGAGVGIAAQNRPKRSSLKQPRPIRTSITTGLGVTPRLGSPGPVFTNSAAIMSPKAMAVTAPPAHRSSVTGGRRRSSVGGGAPGTIDLPPSRYADQPAAAEPMSTGGSRRSLSTAPPDRQTGDVGISLLSTAPVATATAGGGGPGVGSTAPISPSDGAAVEAVAASAANTAPTMTVCHALEDADTAAIPGSAAYYINPNAIGALRPMSAGAQSGKSEGGDEDDDESYVKSRISVVKRLRNFAVAGLQLFHHTDHIGPSSTMPQTLSKSRRGASIGGAAADAASTSRRKLWATAGHKAAMLAALNQKPNMEVVAAQATKDFAVIERLRLVTRWDFDVFEFSSNTEERPLAYISYELFVRFKLFELLHVQEHVFTAFINRLEHLYCFDPTQPNRYHTSLHAADVVQAVGHFLTVPRLSNILDGLDAYSVLVSAIIHDFRHPGVSNNFLVKTSHPIALRYNDESVLENFHAAEAFAVMANERHNISASLTPQQRSTSRFTIIKTVLATDLAQVRGVTSYGWGGVMDARRGYGCADQAELARIYKYAVATVHVVACFHVLARAGRQSCKCVQGEGASALYGR